MKVMQVMIFSINIYMHIMYTMHNKIDFFIIHTHTHIHTYTHIHTHKLQNEYFTIS
jgi:hypothetical protein